MSQDQKVKNTKTGALQLIQHACNRCCRAFTHTPVGMECSLSKDTTPAAPSTPCPLPALYGRIFKDKQAPDQVTEEYVESLRPVYDAEKGAWSAPVTTVATDTAQVADKEVK